jgi:molybdate transport system ATP-binding protein
MDDALIELRNVDVDLNGSRVLRGVSWKLHRSEHWMIHGPNGSGKSTFLRLLRGEVWPVPKRGERIYRLDGSTQMTAIEVRRHIALISPETQERYLQQDWRMNTRDVIDTGFAQSDMLYVKLTRAQQQRGETLASELGIKPLMDRDMQSLSTGELRKVLIARAVVGRPAVLLLDEVCDGLDAVFRTGLLHMIETIARHGTQIVYTTHRPDEPLSIITHELRFKAGRAECGQNVHASEQRAASVSRARPHSKRQRDAGGTLIQIENADVFLDRSKVLQGIRWQLKRGEHWAVLGGNGAGKTTFLKLIASDLYPAFGSRVARFELKADNTIWDLRRRIGCVSPLLQTHYREQVTGEEVVASGFFSSIGLMEKPSATQLGRARALLREFGLGHLRSRSMLAMSFGELRKVLTLRALVHDPELIIFDEPFDGLDAESRRDFRSALERVAARGTQLLVVTHHLDDLPRCITHGLFLERGRIAVEGEWPEVRAHAKVVSLFGKDPGATLCPRGRAQGSP